MNVTLFRWQGQAGGARRRRLLKLFVLLVLSGAGAKYAEAQIGIYAEFSGAKLNQGSTQYLFGPVVGVYKQRSHGVFATGWDLRASFLSRNGTHLDTGLAGVRFAITPHVLPLRPYAEALLGIGNYGTGSVTGSNTGSNSTNVEYQFLAGVDDAILPHVDWRVIEFSYGGLSVLNGSYNPKSLSTGIVIRLR